MGLWAPMMLPHHLGRSVDPAPRPLPRASPGRAPAAVPGSIARSILKGRRVQVARIAMSFAGSHARARGFALARRAPSLPPPGDVRSLVRGAKPRARRGVVVDLADLQIQARRRGAWALRRPGIKATRRRAGPVAYFGVYDASLAGPNLLGNTDLHDPLMRVV